MRGEGEKEESVFQAKYSYLRPFKIVERHLKQKEKIAILSAPNMNPYFCFLEINSTEIIMTMRVMVSFDVVSHFENLFWLMRGGTRYRHLSMAGVLSILPKFETDTHMFETQILELPDGPGCWYIFG